MRRLTTLICFLGCLSISVAQSQSIELESIAVKTQANHWQVTPHYDMALSEAIVEAIHNGIEISFVSEIRLMAEKNWWPDKTLDRIEKRFEIHYFSLTNQYQLRQLGDSKSTAYMNLESLLTEMTQKTRFNIETQPQATAVEGRFYLDQRALPSTMQLPILLDPQWSLKASPLRQALPAMDKP